MASNKNQHFVPRCYLRSFTTDGENSAAINLYNIDRRRFIENAPLKHQCSGDYFYGKDAQLEKVLQLTEAQYAATLREILAPGYKLSEEHRIRLKRFWLLQHLRTEAASKQSSEMIAQMTTSPTGYQDPRYRLEIKDAVQMAMLVFAENMRLVDDMKVCLVKNRSPIPFVTSDDPAVLTNRLHLECSKPILQSIYQFGLKSAGDIFLLPLSPRVLLIAYDGDVHSVPNEGGWVEARNGEDIQALNEHQLLNCRANVFVQSSEHSTLVHEAFERVASSRVREEERHIVNYSVVDKELEGYTRYRSVSPAEAEERGEALVHVINVRPKPVSWPRLLKWRSKGCAYTNGSSAGYVRESETHVRRSQPFRKVATPF